MNKPILSLLAVCAALMLAPASLLAQDGNYVEGVHYNKIPQPEGTVRVDGVLVEEAFSYLCSHCNTFEPYLSSWKAKLPEGVQFKRLPVEFGRGIWGLYAKAYLTAAVLGIEDEGHMPMMDALWKERRQMRTLNELAEFYTQFGVEKDRFLATANSFAVDMSMKREQQKVRDYGIQGTPSVVVNGKYLVSAGGQVRSFQMLLDIVDHLVAAELEEEAKRQAAAG